MKSVFPRLLDYFYFVLSWFFHCFAAAAVNSYSADVIYLFLSVFHKRREPLGAEFGLVSSGMTTRWFHADG